MAKVKIVSLLLLLLAFVGGSAYADTYNITTGSYFMDKIGNDGSQGTNYDTLNLAPETFTLSGPTGSVWAGVPIELVTFTVGYSCYAGPGCQTNTNGIATLQFDVNGNLFAVNVPWHVDVSSADTLTLYSVTTFFDLPGLDRLILTTDELVMGPYGPTQAYEGTLLGDFQSVPEPGTMLLLGGSLTALPWIRRKTRL